MTPAARRGAFVVALLVLLGGSISSHGYLLIPSCEEAPGTSCRPPPATCTPEAAPACPAGVAPLLASSTRTPPDAGGTDAPEDPCRSCDQECCLAVSVAIAGHAAPWDASAAPPRAPSPSRVSLRREGDGLFRPPLA